MSEIEVGQQWRHKKRGHVYEIVAIDAMIQLSSIGDDEVATVLEDEDWIIYRLGNGHRMFVRMREEFLDGRFEQLPTPQESSSDAS
jgi:hypothetical protein